MIIKNKSKSLLITLSFLLIIPFVQKQWFNLYLFNIKDISFYSIIYYLSGIICPSLICLNSLDNFTYYTFNRNHINSKKLIKGNALLLLVVTNLIFISLLVADYLFINFDLIYNLFFESFTLKQPDILHLSFYIFLIAILLIFNKSRLLFKKLVLLNFAMVSFLIWYLQINNININNQYHIYNYFGLNNINLINIFFLVTIEISYFMWSFLSYKTNLSDWIVYLPEKGDMTPIFNILIFYIFIVIYYLILT